MRIGKTLVIGALALSGAATTALAEPIIHPDPFADDDYLVSVRVHLGDLNLRSYRGANIALDRIAPIAAAACGNRPQPVEIGYREQTDRFYACREHKMRLAVEDTHSRAVERAYAERFGGVIVDD